LGIPSSSLLIITVQEQKRKKKTKQKEKKRRKASLVQNGLGFNLSSRLNSSDLFSL